ncbi:hypothetical protein LguiB_033540 [Lonicera macranthoides]
MFDFNIHISCALLVEDVIIHKGHHHPLTFVQRSASFFCDACRTQGKELKSSIDVLPALFGYTRSATSPNTIIRSYHKHPFILSYSLPNTFQNFSLLLYLQKHNAANGLDLLLRPVPFFAHIKCAKSEEEPLVLRDVVEAHPPTIIYQPKPRSIRDRE